MARDVSDGISEDRVFTDRTTRQFVDKIKASAEKRGGTCVWVRSSHIGGSGKLYVLRRLAIVDGGVVVAVARCNRRGAVYWHVPWSTERFEIEQAITGGIT